MSKAARRRRRGLERGDLITAIDGKLVESPESFGFRFGTKPIGGTVNLTVRRGTKTKQVDVKLERAPDVPKPDAVTIAGASPFAGITAVNLSPAVEEELSSPENRDGVVITSVAPESNAAAVAFQKGDMILAINDVPIKTTRNPAGRDGLAQLLLEALAPARRRGDQHRAEPMTFRPRRDARAAGVAAAGDDEKDFDNLSNPGLFDRVYGGIPLSSVQ